MTVEVLQNISITCYIIAGLFFVATLVFFFLNDIPKVIGNLSGHTARREIEEIRKKNDEPENTDTVLEVRYENRTKVTDRMDDIQNRDDLQETVLLDRKAEKQEDAATEVLFDYPETQVITNSCVQVDYDITFLASKEKIL